MAFVMSFLNRLLPFATPGTPIIQDLLHLVSLCVVLYFAPEIQHYVQKWRFTKPAEDESIDIAGQRLLDGTVDGGLGEPDNAGNNGPDDEEHIQPRNDIDEPQDDMDFDTAQEFQAEANFIEEGQPGPAQDRPLLPQRNVGAKKAKSLARKDQRRAYHEFMRSQGDAERARDAEGAREREAALVAERERRKLVEKELDSRKAKERESRKEREDRERKENFLRTELALSIVEDELESQNACDLFKVAKMVGDDIDEEWIEKILKASGLIGKKNDSVTMITQLGWIVRVTAQNMQTVYQRAMANEVGDEHGHIASEQVASLLENLLKEA